ncbi:MAG: DUF5615 family PIN-like protein [Blastocatellia bacterium]
MLKYLLDEHVSHAYCKQLLRRESSLTVHTIGDPGVPPKGTLDPELLLWCERESFVNPLMSFGDTIEELILLAMASVEYEFSDKITFLPYKG